MYIITGGAGFIGSNIVAALEARGETDIVIVDRLRNAQKWRNIAKHEIYDIVSPDDIFEYLNGRQTAVEAVIHMGAVSSTMETDVDKIFANNFSLSYGLWKWCAFNGTRFIYASSASTYGDGSNGFKDNYSIEGLAKLRPLNAYGWSKHIFDRKVARMITAKGQIPRQWAGLKFFNVYGPNEYHKGVQQSVISHIFPHARENVTCSLFRSYKPDYEDGGQLRDFVWVGDVVNVVLWLLDNPNVNGIYNVGSGKARSFNDLAKATYRAMNLEPKIKYIDAPNKIRGKYQYFTEAPMDSLRATGYNKPSTSLEDGVTKYVCEFLNTSDPYR
ncbi:MAG: ADP-glyceromanno-heptose 6-epimerase [Alphaproteobacteria bacterium]|nr:ADP-glyceromanno-heptose 6-epimerase [Alphaproteobacteria bacterium]